MLLSPGEIERELLAGTIFGRGDVVPRYDGQSTINLTSSIVQALGGAPPSAPLRPDVVEPAIFEGARTILLLILDAYGYDQFVAELADGAAPAFVRLVANPNTRLVPLTTVFPSTTSAALVSLQTGVSPREHGNAGFNAYLPRVDAVANLLFFFLAQNPKVSLVELGIDPAHWLGVPTIYQILARAGVPSFKVNPGDYVNSPLSVMTSIDSTYVPYVNVSDFFSQIRRAYAEARQHPRSLVCAYFPGVDTISHVYGTQAPEHANQVAVLDWLFQREILDQTDLTDAVVVITADHGHNNTGLDHTIFLNDLPELLELLRQPPGGDGRARYLYAKPNQADAVRAFFEARSPTLVDTLPTPEYLWLFGNGPIHPDFPARVGDVLALPRSGWNLYYKYLAGEVVRPFVGLHGGLHRSEMLVPAIIYRR